MHIKPLFQAFESIQMVLNHITRSLWLGVNRFMSFWILSHLNRFKIVWIVSWKLSNLCWIDSSFIFSVLNRFKYGLMHINLHSSSGFSFRCLKRFKHLMNRFTMLCLAKKIAHPTLFYIYSHFHNTQNIESFASILSRVSKPRSSYLNTFSWNHFDLWVIDC